MMEPQNKTIENGKKLYNYIYHNFPVSKSKLKELSGFTLTTLNRAMDLLIEENLIYVSNVGESSGGRKPALYSINIHSGYIIGIDISRTYTKVTLMDLGLNILKSVTLGMFSKSMPEDILDKIEDIINSFYKKFPKEKILGIGIGAVGPIDSENGTILNPSGFLADGWRNIEIKKILEKKTGLITVLQGGANAAVLGEHIKGVGKNLDNIAYISLGIGIRLGVIHNNEIFSTSNEDAFGHIIIDFKGRKCLCGKKGCLDAYVSINAILDRFKEAIEAGEYSRLTEEIEYDLSEINIDNFLKAAENGDRLALKIVDETAEYLSAAISNLINILNSKLIIMGGPLINKSSILYDRTLQKITDNANEVKAAFSKGLLKDNAIVTGATSEVLEYYLK